MMQADKTKSGRLLLPCLVMATLMLGGCAGGAGLFGSAEPVTPFRDPAMSMQGAKSLVIAGQTTKADLLAALGKATVIKFDSGYEVWVYRTGSRDSSANNAELVMLLTPAGVVKKSRLRPASSARPL